MILKIKEIANVISLVFSLYEAVMVKGLKSPVITFTGTSAP